MNQFNVLQASLTAAQNQASLTNLDSFNKQTTTMLQGFNEVGRDAANNAAAAQLAATVHSAAISKELCEIKAKITCDGDKTRALINDLRVQDLQTQLADAKNAAINANQTQQTQQILDKIYYNQFNYNGYNNGGCGCGGHGHGNGMVMVTDKIQIT